MPKNTGLFPGGTTSAHAENTFSPSTSRTPPKNYLRVRGEYATRMWAAATTAELPPRARRIHRRCRRRWWGVGTTSAHAENTKPRS